MSLEEKIFQDANDLLGDPIKDWEFFGIEFNDDSPHLLYYPEEGKIAISLSLEAKNNEVQYVFQLAHELCHLFYPSIEFPSLKKSEMLVINEGISTYFSIKTTSSVYKNEEYLLKNLKNNSNNYYQAFKLVDQLIKIDLNSIKKLRLQQARLNYLKKNDFQNAQLALDSELIDSLLKPFQ
ncbi:hypothetical protein [Pedobacter puniceum]|uniref:Uncharacterized protein n=1 Tax=Pedobacter puniceum TaxID=2666136 RepID=A0A7K0FJ64_9SPHI|nr:hypothetical protein [Pedobacter puniceum]MRX45842.1 hypothetical protein [Pedobacter puniceum]